MEHTEVTFSKWKNLNSLFYSKGIHTLKMYEDGNIELTNFQGKTYNFETLTTTQQGSRLAYSVRNKNSGRIGTLVLTSNGRLILVFENMDGIKLKQ